MSKISNAVVAALSATATGSGGGGMCRVNGDWLIGDFQIAAFHFLVSAMVLVRCGQRQRYRADSGGRYAYHHPFVPAQAGTQRKKFWISAYAGMSGELLLSCPHLLRASTSCLATARKTWMPATSPAMTETHDGLSIAKPFV